MLNVVQTGIDELGCERISAKHKSLDEYSTSMTGLAMKILFLLLRRRHLQSKRALIAPVAKLASAEKFNNVRIQCNVKIRSFGVFHP
jgi:hypothetical protein